MSSNPYSSQDDSARPAAPAGQVPGPGGQMRQAQDDDDACSGIFKGLLKCGGVMSAAACCPCAACGAGPVVEVQEGYQGLLMTYGKMDRVLGAGLYHYNPCTQEIIRRSLKIRVIDVSRQAMITRDNVSVKINAVVYYRVFDVEKSVFAVDNAEVAISNISQSTLRNIVGEHTLDELFSERDEINANLRHVIDVETDPWGIKVTNVEIKDISIPKDMQRALASVAEAQREGSAKIITAQAELNAAQTLAEAADVMATNPLTLQLRYFQTLGEVAAENNETTIIPTTVQNAFSGLSLFGQLAEGSNGGSSGGGPAAFDYDNALDIRAQVEQNRRKREKEDRARAKAEKKRLAELERERRVAREEALAEAARAAQEGTVPGAGVGMIEMRKNESSTTDSGSSDVPASS